MFEICVYTKVLCCIRLLNFALFYLWRNSFRMDLSVVAWASVCNFPRGVEFLRFSSNSVTTTDKLTDRQTRTHSTSLHGSLSEFLSMAYITDVYFLQRINQYSTFIIDINRSYWINTENRLVCVFLVKQYKWNAFSYVFQYVLCTSNAQLIKMV